MRTFFVAYQYERAEPGGTRVGFGNTVRDFEFHPLNDPGRAGAEIAASTGHDVVIVLNVQDMPGNEF
ncbi:hypothetical protein [Verrucosispora sp. WMMC514]|uniref:hypothetical protein n=1 Tax=Verrucosispora sp. WMMC514 TaxID=3015156 RepID=UPI00248ACB47|nr:hypothetical protein [Verrucosispora sp. WMMC514]WBB94123.1 hypothetical protein O7597_14840 [Verrucosispora sp. WMMC514]